MNTLAILCVLGIIALFISSGIILMLGAMLVYSAPEVPKSIENEEFHTKV